MITFAELQTDIQTECNDTSSGTQTFIQNRLDRWQKNVCSETAWNFLRATATSTTVAGTQTYNLPVQNGILRSVKITVGNVDYYPLPIASQDMWDSLTRNSNNTVQSDIVQYYFITNGQINFYPKPATSSNTITYTYIKKPKKLKSTDFTDKSAGTVSITNGDDTVTGSTTSFAATDVGRYIIFTGDYGYEIASYASTTSIDITRNYEGTTISGGTYLLGTIPLIPEDHTDILKNRVLADIWRRREDFVKAREYDAIAEDMTKSLYKEDKRMYASPEINVISERTLIDPNNYPTNLSAI